MMCDKRAVRVLILFAAGATLIGWSLSSSGARFLSAGLQVARETLGGEGPLHPRPAYLPQEVVRLQIEALGDNDLPYPDAGIEITFRFASPSNKKVTGPLRQFIEMVHNPAYRPMLNHRGARYGKLRQDGRQAVQTVVLIAKEGGRVGYRFELSRQTGAPFKDCWMTDSVMRFEVREDYQQV